MATACAESKMPLTAGVAGFAAHLRLNGWRIGTSELRLALGFTADIETLDLRSLRQGLKVLLSSRKSEWDRFDDLFEAFWFGRGRVRRTTPTVSSPDSWSSGPASLWSRHLGHESPQGPQDLLQAVEASAHADDASQEERVGLAASRRTRLERTDLRHVSARDEVERAERIAYRLAAAMRYRRSRRFALATRQRRVDLRRTLRRNMSHGGELLTLVHRDRPDRPVRVVVLLDVSGSMQPYCRFLLQFVKGLVRSWEDADAYLAHTRLLRVTDVLKEKDAMLAMGRLSLICGGFGGGTRLAHCVGAFNDSYAKRALNSRSVLVVISDGYDTDEPERLVEELARLRRRARKLVWLNPLLGWSDYRPETRTMKAALPYIDHFAAAHSLEALLALEPQLHAL